MRNLLLALGLILLASCALTPADPVMDHGDRVVLTHPAGTPATAYSIRYEVASPSGGRTELKMSFTLKGGETKEFTSLVPGSFKVLKRSPAGK